MVFRAQGHLEARRDTLEIPLPAQVTTGNREQNEGNKAAGRERHRAPAACVTYQRYEAEHPSIMRVRPRGCSTWPRLRSVGTTRGRRVAVAASAARADDVHFSLWRHASSGLQKSWKLPSSVPSPSQTIQRLPAPPRDHGGHCSTEKRTSAAGEKRQPGLAGHGRRAFHRGFPGARVDEEEVRVRRRPFCHHSGRPRRLLVLRRKSAGQDEQPTIAMGGFHLGGATHTDDGSALATRQAVD